MTSSSTSSNGGFIYGKVWDVLVKICVPLVFIGAGALITHEVRISQIEGNRFTSKDAMQQERDLKKWMEDRYPPAWLRDQLGQIHTQMDILPSLGAKMDALVERVQRLEAKVDR